MVNSLAHFSPDVPISIVGDINLLPERERKYIDKVVSINNAHLNDATGRIAPGKFKLHLDLYSPYDETMYIDIDGVAVQAGEDWMIVEGAGSGRPAGGGTVATYMDHRIAMAFLVLGLVSEKPVTVDDGGMISTSFPDFVPLMNGLGAALIISGLAVVQG